MQNLTTIRAQVPPMPRYQLFQTVWVYSVDDHDNGCFDKGVIAGFTLPQTDLDSREWWYLVWLDRYPRIPHLAPLTDWAPESSLLTLATATE